MSSQIPTVSVRDLVDEAKKRIVILIVCVIGLSYLMSLTSSSVLVNLPAAMFLIIIVRYLSLEFDMRRKTAIYKSKPTSENSTKRELSEGPRVIGERSDWKNKVNSPIVEEALDHFTRHIISEWVTDLWYSRITTDRQVPEELVLIMNGVLAEISNRMRNVNLLDLITRDTINLLCSQLELFHETMTKIEEQQSRFLTIEERDIEMKSVLAADNKLHPALFSAKAEHKVLQHVMDGVILFTFRPEDLQCSLFRYITRELLACVVIRPIINLANARFINERIESLIFSANKTAMVATHMASQSRINGSTQVSSEDISESTDHSVNGVELVKLKDQHKKGDGDLDLENTSGTLLSKDPLLSMDTRSTLSWNSTPYIHNCDGKDIQQHRSGEAWGGSPNVFSHKQIDPLAPEHLDNIWEKGRNYKTKGDVEQLDDPVQRNSLGVLSNPVEQPKQKKNELEARDSSLDKGVLNSGYCEHPGDSDASIHDTLTKENQDSVSLREGDFEDKSLPSEEVESWSSSYSEDEDTSNITGLDAPGIKFWDVKNKRNSSHIHHPLETLDGHRSIKARKGHLIAKRSHRTKSAKKRSRSSDYNGHLWQEGERTSVLLGDGQDILNSTDVIDKSDDGETELLGRAFSEATTSQSFSSASLPGNHNLATSSATNSIIADSFFKLRCEVSGGNIVKSGSKTFTVYSISVTGVNNNSWTIKRRFQHFEELHRRLKEFPEYDLHLPPKHFLSTGLDVTVIQERCTLLDQYLKKLLQLPTISCSIEVWDFLSVDSQMYTFSDSLSIIAFPVDLNGVYEKNKGHRKNAQPVSDPISSMKENFRNENQHPESHIKRDHGCDDSTLKARDQSLSSKKPEKEVRETFQESNGESQNSEPKNTLSARNMERAVNGDGRATLSSDAIYVSPDATLPIEWVPPNISVPLLDLVEVILQLKDGGWIRRQVFWVVKQVLQLGMGDALDDWLIGKIQLLRQGSVVASGIRRLETLLWPDGIFLTKHPRRQQPQLASPVQNSSSDQPSTPCSPQLVDNIQNMEEMQQKEAERRAKLVYEVMIDKAPAAIVGLVGRKEYEQSAKDLCYFIQSSVFMKQLTFELLQLLLLSLFPELDPVFRQLYDEKESFGELEKN